MFNKIKSFNNTEDKKRLMSNFFSLSILQAFTYVLPLLTLPYLVRILGVEQFGLVMFAQAFIIFFNIFVDYGFNLSATREIAVYRENKEKLTEIFSAVMFIRVVLIFIAFIILNLIVFSFEKFSNEWQLYELTFLWVIGQAMFPIWYFQGMEKMKYITIVNIVSKVLFTVLIFIVIQTPDDYLYVPLLNGFGFIVGAIISLFMIHNNFKQSFKFQNFKILKKHFLDSSQFFLSRVSVTLYTSANTFILGLLTNNTMVGYYTIAEKLYMALQSFYSPIVQALYPYVAKEKNIRLFKKIFYILLVLNTLGILILFFISQDIFNILFTQTIGIESVKVFNILLLAALVLVPSIILGYPFLAALGFAKYPNMSVVYASIVHIGGIASLVVFDNITIYTVSMMVVITQTVDLMYRLYGIRKEKLWNLK